LALKLLEQEKMWSTDPIIFKVALRKLRHSTAYRPHIIIFCRRAKRLTTKIKKHPVFRLAKRKKECLGYGLTVPDKFI